MAMKNNLFSIQARTTFSQFARRDWCWIANDKVACCSFYCAKTSQSAGPLWRGSEGEVLACSIIDFLANATLYSTLSVCKSYWLNSTKLIIQGNFLYGRNKVIRYGSTFGVIKWLKKLWGSICYQILSPSSLFCWREFFGHQEIRVGRYFVHCIELKKNLNIKYFSILKDIFSDFLWTFP